MIRRDFIQVLQGLASEGKQRSPEGFECLDQFGPVADFAPVIPGLWLPRRTPQRPTGDATQAGGGRGVLTDSGGVGMGGVEQQIDPFIADELRQAFGTAIAANTNLASQIRRHPTDTGQAVDVLWPQGSGNRQGLGDATEQQQAFHWKAPAWPTIPPWRSMANTST